MQLLHSYFCFQNSSEPLWTETEQIFDSDGCGGGVNLKRGFLFDGQNWLPTKEKMAEERLSPACSLVLMDGDEVIR